MSAEHPAGRAGGGTTTPQRRRQPGTLLAHIAADVTPTSMLQREPSFSFNPHNRDASHTVVDSPTTEGAPRPGLQQRRDTLTGDLLGLGAEGVQRSHSGDMTINFGGAAAGGSGGPLTPHAAPTDNSASAAAATNSNYSARVFIGLDRVLVVHFLPTERSGSLSPADQLLNHARVAIPAILNYLYFRASKVAVVYFGKTRRADGVKVGVEGGEDMKRKMIRFMTTEVWPPLRTDVPDDSRPVGEAGVAGAAGGTASSTSGGGGGGSTSAAAVGGDATSGDGSSASRRKSRAIFHARSTDMQALIYLKPAANDTSYVKLVLTGSEQLHFDITDARDEKHRWEGRKLHIRMLDSLETQKAIFSYEEYEKAFRAACAFCLQHGEALDAVCLNQAVIVQTHPPTGTPPAAFCGGSSSSPSSVLLAIPPTDAPFGTTPMLLGAPMAAAAAAIPPAATPSKPAASSRKTSASEWFGPMRTTYDFFERLDKPESATLDYKSYFANPVAEIVEKATKFMCGFLNAYGYGRLIIGVHEMPLKVVLQAQAEEAARCVSPSTTVGGESVGSALGTSPAAVVPPKLSSRGKDDDNEQIVIGVSITQDDLDYIQTEMSLQLQQCVPPIPPSAVRIDCIPVTLPISNGPVHVLIFYEPSGVAWKDLFRQKSNSAIRSLSRHHMSICPIPFDDRVRKLVPVDAAHVQCFAIINSPQQWSAVKTPLVGPGGYADRSISEIVDAQFVPIDDEDDWGGDEDGESGEGAATTTSSKKSKRKNVAAAAGSKGGRKGGGALASTSTMTASITSRSSLSVDPNKPMWWFELEHHLPQVKGGRHHIIATLDAPYELPCLYVVDISVNCNRMDALWRGGYDRGKYFNGWPSIPIWDTNTHQVTRVERHYDIFTSRSRSHLVPGSRSWWTDVTIVPIVIQFLFGVDVDPKKRHVCVCEEGDLLRYRRVCGSFDEQYRTLQGFDLLSMLQQWGTKGFLQLKCTYTAVRDMQNALKFSRLSMMPLLLAWTYQLVGTLPAPYPFAPVPLALQSIRPSPFLIPIYFKGPSNTCTLTLHIALDTRDGILKRVVLSKDKSRVEDLVPVRGVGFALIAHGELGAFRRKQQEAIDAEERRMSVRNRRKSRMPVSSSLGSLPIVAAFEEVTEAAPSIHFRFLSPADSIGNVPWSLKNLLVWLQSALHHPNIKAVGHCNRSFAFVCDLVTEVCPAHFQAQGSDGGGRRGFGPHAESPSRSGAHTPTTSEPSRIPSMSPTSEMSVRYPAFFDCQLHRAEHEWAQWE